MHLKLIFVFILTGLLGCLSASTPALTDAAVYEDSALWPPRAELTRDFTSADTEAPRTIPSGREAILIRLEPGEPVHAVLDFGRLGLHRVPLAHTDIIDRAQEIAAGEVKKETPNWTMMIGRAFSRHKPEAGQGGIKVPFAEVEAFRYFLVAYLDGGPEANRAVAALLEEHQDAFQAAAVAPIIFGMGDFPYIGELTYIETLREHGLDQQFFMAPHVSVPYANAMAHSYPSLPAIALVDAEGKTLYEPGSESVSLEAMFGAVHAIITELKVPKPVDLK
jgi:hypothetical protein